MDAELVSQANAEKIKRLIKDRGGTINSSGCIEGNFSLYTDNIKTWINEFKADFWVLNKDLRISNWPKPQPLPPGKYTCRVIADRGDETPIVAISAVVTEGKYKGMIIPVPLEDC